MYTYTNIIYDTYIHHIYTTATVRAHTHTHTTITTQCKLQSEPMYSCTLLNKWPTALASVVIALLSLVGVVVAVVVVVVRRKKEGGS